MNLTKEAAELLVCPYQLNRGITNKGRCVTTACMSWEPTKSKMRQAVKGDMSGDGNQIPIGAHFTPNPTHGTCRMIYKENT